MNKNAKSVLNAIETQLETISAMIKATGTENQRKVLPLLQDEVGVIATAEGEDYVVCMDKITKYLEELKNEGDYISSEIRHFQYSASELTTLVLKDYIAETRDKIEKEKTINKVFGEEDKETTVVDHNGNVHTEESRSESEAGADEDKSKFSNSHAGTAEAKMSEDENAKTEEKAKTKEEIIADLEEQLKKAKEENGKQNKSSLGKIALKTTIGAAVLGAVATSTYYATKYMSSKNTTIIIDGDGE